MIKFSIIIPVYNIEQYISKCIESVIHQKYKELQIILVDDGSADRSGEICDSYAERDQRICVLHQKNKGVVGARLAGIENANGDYLVCIDGDDWVEDDYFEYLNYIINTYSPDLICEGYKMVGDESHNYHVPYRSGYYSKDDIEHDIFSSLICDNKGKIFPQQLWAKAIRKTSNVKQLFNIDPNINIGEDSAITIPLVTMASSMFITDRTSYCYRYNPDSLTKAKRPLDWNNLKIWYNNIISALQNQKKSMIDQIMRYGVISLFDVAASQFCSNSNYKVIVENIDRNLNDELFQRFIRNAFFNKKSKQSIKHWILKNNYYVLLFVFYKFHYSTR